MIRRNLNEKNLTHNFKMNQERETEMKEINEKIDSVCSSKRKISEDASLLQKALDAYDDSLRELCKRRKVIQEEQEWDNAKERYSKYKAQTKEEKKATYDLCLLDLESHVQSNLERGSKWDKFVRWRPEI